MPLTGVSATSAVGSITAGIAEIIPLTGVEAVTSVGSVGTLGYKRITATQNAGYTRLVAN